MKKLLIPFAFLLIVSCGRNAEKTITEPGASPADAEMEAEIQRAKQETLDSINMATIRQRTIDSMNAVAAASAPVKSTKPSRPTRRTTTATSPSAPAPSGSNPSTVSSGNNNTASNTTTTAAEPEKKKKGINNAVKGALIGLGTGAAAGAVIDKDKRGRGAIIGGVIGATGGALGGAIIDKNKKKKARQDSIEQARIDSINRASENGK